MRCLRAIHELIRLMCNVDTPIKLEKGRPKMPKEIKQIGKLIHNKKSIKRTQKNSQKVKQLTTILTPDVINEISHFVCDKQELVDKLREVGTILYPSQS